MKDPKQARIAAPLAGTMIGAAVNYLSQNATFAVTDDYRLITSADQLRPFLFEGHARLEASTGRVVPGFLFKLIWFGVRDIGDLWYVRLIGVGLVAMSIAAFLVWFAIRAKLTSRTSLFVLGVTGALSMLLPGVAATTTWATKTAHLMALPFAMTGGIIATASPMTRRRWSVVALLVFCSVFSYQHFALFAVLPVVVKVALDANEGFTLRYIKRPFIVVGIGLTAVLANVVFVRLMGEGVLNRISNRPLTNRFKELIDVSAKGALLYVERSSPLVLATVLVASALLYSAFKHGPRTWRLLSALSGSVAGSVLLTFGGDGESSFRMVLPTQLTVWLGLGIVGAYIVGTSSQKQSRSALLVPLALIMAVLVALISTTDVIRNDIALRNANDWTNTTCEVKRVVSGEIPERIEVQLRPVEISGPDAVRSEIGLTASQISWLFLDQWALAVRSVEGGNVLAKVPIRIIDESSEVMDDDSYRIDLRSPCVSAVD